MQKSKTYAIINVRRTGDGVNNKTNMLTCAYADTKTTRRRSGREWGELKGKDEPPGEGGELIER